MTAPAPFDLGEVLDRVASPSISLVDARDLFAEAVARATIRGHAIGVEEGRRQAADEYEDELEALRASGRELCSTVAAQLRLIIKGMTSQPFDGSLEMIALADQLDPS